MLARSCVGLQASRAAAAFRPIVNVKPVRLAAPAPVRRVLPVIRAAAAEAPAVAEVPAVSGPKSAAAHLRSQRGSVHKVRRVLDVIRGRSYEEALLLMEYMPYRACEKILKCLMSAAANAKNNEGALKTKLYVSECFADGGTQLKRAKPRAQGRAYKILKPTFHMTIRVTERQ